MIPGRQEGIALILVLWVTALLSIATGAFAMMARVEQIEANALLNGTRARMAAEGAIHLTALALRETDDQFRLLADGRIYTSNLGEALLEISIIDERGKLDINVAEESTLFNLFLNHGMEYEQAEQLAAAVMDWRDDDDIERVNGAELDSYLSVGLEVGPGNRLFLMTEELLQVLGMTYELFLKIEPGITVYSRMPTPELAFAPVEALLAIPDIGLDDATSFVNERNSMQAGEMDLIKFPDGRAVMAQGKGLTYSIRAKATMPNGVWEQLETTIRLGGDKNGLPFRTLRWREGYYH